MDLPWLSYKDSLRVVMPLLLSLAIGGSLSSCGLGVRTRALLGGKVDLKVYVADTANRNSPVAVDVLLVYDKDLLQSALKMSAREWFEKREQITRDYREGEGLDVWRWEWVPGQSVPLQALPLKAKAKAIVIYANYASPGDHRARVDPHASVVLQLLEKDFSVRPLK
ncbi:MAG: type VI secretion protein [Nitrospinae bacterium]|nr:type VI secretion protein [Nitrospinota bacterium]